MSDPAWFGGSIGRTLSDSEAWFEEPPHPGSDAPNVVFVLLDDTGFAQLGCFGSDIDTPNIDALAAGGLQFTNFHVTPLCSPTRASLLTGRSQHAVGMRTLSNFRTGFPNQLGHVSNHAATVAEVLGQAGYATFCAGKWHLAPMEQGSAAGPFDQWPLGRGFDRFYGFLEGETDQFHPDLVCDNHHIDAPAGPDDGYHLSEDLVDQLLTMISDTTAVRPDRPFFAYLPFGATHAPHQAPPDYLAKYRGRYDQGWDVAREHWFRRQIELGVIPPDTELAPRNPGVEAWEDLTENQQRFAARLQEAFAAFLDHTDDQIGRLVEGLRERNLLDDTVFVVMADNGASQEGGPLGTLHEMKYFNFVEEDVDAAVDQLDDIGGPASHTNYPWGWAQCGNTPFRWYKQNTHEGGVHVPMVMHWPNGIDPAQNGTKRDQFVNVADVVPTVYELVGVDPPAVYRGLEQMPVTGHSFASVLDDADAPAPNRVQYFEMMGSRALVAGEWKAVCRHEAGADFDSEPWELYHLATDWSETRDLAAQQPEKLAELQQLWWQEAERHGVLPIDDRLIELFGARFRANSPHPPDKRYVYRPPMSPLPGQAAAAIAARPFDITATVIREPGDEGVLYAMGNGNSGLTMFVQGDRLVFDYNAFGDHGVVESGVAVPVGRSTLEVGFRLGEGRTGRVTLAVDGVPAGSVDIPMVLFMMSSTGVSVGCDRGLAVSPRYQSPFTFSGELVELVVQSLDQRDVDRHDAAVAEARAEMARQ